MARLLLVAFLLSACVQRADVRSYKYIVSYPFVQKMGDSTRFIYLKDTLLVFFYNDYVLYQIPAMEWSYNKTGIDEQKAFTYFLYKNKEQYGYAFGKMENSARLTKVGVDSFLTQRAFKGEFSVQNQFRVDSSYDNVMKVVLEKYVPPKANEYSFDSIYFYYSPVMSNYDFSISGSQDSLGKGKLFKVRLLYNQYFSESNNIMMPKREFLFKFERYVEFDPKPIITFLDKFKGS